MLYVDINRMTWRLSELIMFSNYRSYLHWKYCTIKNWTNLGFVILCHTGRTNDQSDDYIEIAVDRTTSRSFSQPVVEVNQIILLLVLYFGINKNKTVFCINFENLSFTLFLSFLSFFLSFLFFFLSFFCLYDDTGQKACKIS